MRLIIYLLIQSNKSCCFFFSLINIMPSQIFKNAPPKKIMYDFLDKYATKNNTKYYYVSNIIFRQADLKNDIDTFCELMKEYYHKSKQHYATRKLNYITFMRFVQSLKNIFLN